MEIVLTYQGRIPGQARSPGNSRAIWEMRHAFHLQLAKLWGKSPFSVLKEWEDGCFSAGAPRFTREYGGFSFVPYYGDDVGIGVSLDITLLTGMPVQKPILVAGDLDNRVKRIVDALRVPIRGEIPPNAEAARIYCLMENDSAVRSLHVEMNMFLTSDDPSISFTLVRARPVPLRLTLDNVAMAM